MFNREPADLLASELGLTCSAANDAFGVVAEAEGEFGAVVAFAGRLVEDAPAMVAVESVQSSVLPTAVSPGSRSRAPCAARADIATCDDCLAEFADPDDRRYRQPFISYTDRATPWSRPHVGGRSQSHRCTGAG